MITRILLILALSQTVVSTAQDRYAFKIGSGPRQIPLDQSDLHDEGLFDIIVRNDTAYCLEYGQIHILPLHTQSEDHIPFPLEDDEVGYAFCFLSPDTLAIAVDCRSARYVGIVLLSMATRHTLAQIRCPYDLSSGRHQGITTRNDTLLVPVLSWPAIQQSVLVLDKNSMKMSLLGQEAFFGHAELAYGRQPIFFENGVIYDQIQHSRWRVMIIERGRHFPLDVPRQGRLTEIRFRIESGTHKLWYSEVVKDSLVIRRINYRTD